LNMKKLLHEIYFSELEKGYPPDSRYAHAIQVIGRIEAEISENLPEALRKRLTDYSEAHMEAAAIASEESFITGYRCGAKLMLAGMGEYTSEQLLSE